MLRRIELAAGLAAVIILAFIGTGSIATTARVGSTPTGGLKLTALPLVVSAAYGPLDPTVFPRHCVKRVADLTHGWPEADIVDQLNQACFSLGVQKPPATSRRAPIAICGRALAWRLSAASSPVMGCSPG